MSHRTVIQPYNIKYIPKNPINTGVPPNIYGFDLDHTLIKPKTPNAIFGRTAQDWTYMEFQQGKPVIEKIFKIVKNDPQALIVIFTNQGGVLTVPRNSKSFCKFDLKISLILESIAKHEQGNDLLRRLWIYASTKKPVPKKNTKQGGVSEGRVMKLTDFGNVKSTENSVKSRVTPDIFNEMRKPGIGLFSEFMVDLKNVTDVDISLGCWKWYCGDAAGRKSDFSDSDKSFAEKAGIHFKLPEDIFM